MQEKRSNDSRNVNVAGPSSTCVRETEEPDFKRGRMSDPEPAVRNLMLNRNNSDRDVREERSINRSFSNRHVDNLNIVGDNIVNLRRMEDRNTDRFQSDTRYDRGFMDNQPVTKHYVEEDCRDIDRMGIRMDQYRDLMAEDTGPGRPELRQNNRMDEFRMAATSNDSDVRRFGGSNSFARNAPFGLERMTNIPESDFNQRDLDRSKDRIMRDFLDDIQRPVRDNLRSGMVDDIDRLGPLFDSAIDDRRNYERDFIADNRDTFSTQSANFQDAMNYRKYDSFPERSISQEFRQITPDRLLGVEADRFLNQSREEKNSLQNFGSRQNDFRGLGSRFEIGDRRNNFDDDINEPVRRWNNFDSRDTYKQDRGDGMDSRRRNDFNQDGRVKFNDFNFNRSNDYDDGFRDRNRNQDFQRRNNDNRFNRFN